MKNLIIILSLFSFNIFAFNLTPLSQSISLGKNSNTVIYQIQNKNKEPIAIEASLKKRNMNTEGKEDLPDVKDGQFLIYPTQIILKPGEKRGIKIQYLGKGEVSSELAYRLLVEQLPIDFKKKKKTGVKLLLRYLGALYVTKDDFKPSVQVKTTKMIGNDFVIEVANSGTKHQVLKNLKLTFYEGSQKKVVLAKDRLVNFNGENILANSSRKFTVSDLLEYKFNSESRVELNYE